MATDKILHQISSYVKEKGYVPYLIEKGDHSELFFYHTSKKEVTFERVRQAGYRVVTEFETIDQLLEYPEDLIEDYMVCVAHVMCEDL